MSANVETMAYHGEVPWHGLGTPVDHVMHAEEAIVAAGLDWEVLRAKVHYGIPSGDTFKMVEDTGHKAFVRSTDHKLMYVGSDNYTPLQNREAFSFFDQIVGDKEAIYHTAGSLNGGKQVWILAKLPGTIKVLKDDVTEQYLLLANGHDGLTAVQVRFTPVRVVCQNTLNAALTGMGNTYTIRHTPGLTARFEEARKALSIAQTYYERLEEQLKALTKVKVDAELTRQFGARLIPDPKPSNTRKEAEQVWMEATAERRRKMFEELVETGLGTEIKGVKGTAYGLYQAACELVDHHWTQKASANSRTTSIWFGEGLTVKNRAMQLATALEFAS